MDKLVGLYILLSYTTFSEEFIIHPDARKTYPEGIISQNGKLIF